MAKAVLLEPNQCDLAKVPRHHGNIGRARCSGTDGVNVSEVSTLRQGYDE
jgi:hypothetical protein